MQKRIKKVIILIINTLIIFLIISNIGIEVYPEQEIFGGVE